MVFKFFESQRKNKTSKDWVTTVLEDMNKMNLNMDFDEIRNMKKSVFMNTIKRKTEYEALKYLETLKEKHSKVKTLKHPVLKMQKYLMPNDMKLKIEECQDIFKLRSKVTEAKMNQKNRYENYECEVCGQFDENQEHVLTCKTILNMHKQEEESETPEYEKLFNGSVKEQVQITKLFTKNMKIIEDIRRKNS